MLCSKFDEIFDNDYAPRHMTKHHPALIAAGNMPTIKLLKKSSQPSVSSFLKKSQPETSFCDQQPSSQNEDPFFQNAHTNFSNHDKQETDDAVPCSSASMNKGCTGGPEIFQIACLRLIFGFYKTRPAPMSRVRDLQTKNDLE